MLLSKKTETTDISCQGNTVQEGGRELTCRVMRTGLRPKVSDSEPAVEEETYWARAMRELEMPMRQV